MSVPHGVQLLTQDDLIEELELAAAEAREQAEALSEQIEELSASPRADGTVEFDAGAVLALKLLAMAIVAHTTDVHDRSFNLALARLGGVQ